MLDPQCRISEENLNINPREVFWKPQCRTGTVALRRRELLLHLVILLLFLFTYEIFNNNTIYKYTS